MQALRFKLSSFKLFTAALLSAGLLELPFPLAGPLPPWRSVFVWFGLVPLLCAILSATETAQPRPLRRAFLLGYLCGVAWYVGNCYWVRDVMMQYGDMPSLAPTLLLLGYSLVLGLYFGLFGLAIALLRRVSGSRGLALAAAPVFWVGLELAASRITSVPWDQLGYSQVDNALVNQLAPWTGVYGISFLLVAANALLAAGIAFDRSFIKRLCGVAGVVLAVTASRESFSSRRSLRPQPRLFSFSPISMWPVQASGWGPASGIAISPTSTAWRPGRAEISSRNPANQCAVCSASMWRRWKRRSPSQSRCVARVARSFF